MVRLSLPSLIAALLVSVGFSTVTHAATFGLNNKVTDFTFTGLNGQPLPETAPGTDPQPQTTVYATDGFPDTPPYTGTSIVGNAGTMIDAAIMTTNQGGIGANYVDTQFLAPVTDKARISFDLDVMSTPTTGIPQPTASAPNGQAFVLQAFGLTTNRIIRFVASPTSATGGVFGLRNNTDGDLHIIGNYNNGDTNHVDLLLDFNTSSAQAYINDTLVQTVPFISGSDTGLSEVFIFQNGVAGVTNQVAWDNLVTATPEPASLALLPLIALMGRRRRATR